VCRCCLGDQYISQIAIKLELFFNNDLITIQKYLQLLDWPLSIKSKLLKIIQDNDTNKNTSKIEKASRSQKNFKTKISKVNTGGGGKGDEIFSFSQRLWNE